MSARVKPPETPTAAGKYIRPGAAIVFTGVLLALAMPPISYYPLAWIALVPIIERWSNLRSPRRAWLEASTAFLVLFAVAGHWVLRHPIWQSAAASLGAGILLPCIHGLPFAAALSVRTRYGRPAGAVMLLLSALGIEYMLLRTPLGLPWWLMGHTQADALAFNQFIAYTGVLGLSAWVWMLNIVVWCFLKSRRVGRVAWTVVLIVLLVGPYVWANLARDDLRPTGHHTVGIVQPAVSPLAWANGPPATRMEPLMRLSDSLVSAAEQTPPLIVWPETAIPNPENPREREAIYARLRSWTHARTTSLLAGTIRYPADGRGGPSPPYNSAALIRPSGGIEHYDKRRLVPFAEYVPGASAISWLSHLAVESGGVPGYRPGDGPGVMRIDSMKMAVQICFESVFGHLHREAFRRGSSYLVVLAQNGWWGNSAGPYQHRSITRLRAIESRRAVVMVSAAGGSSLIRPDGQIDREMNWMEPGAVALNVPRYERQTFYVRHGDWLGVAAVLLTAVGAALWIGALIIANRMQ